MIKTRVRKIIRDVWARKGRTALVSMAIFIGVAGTIALFSMSDALISQLREDIKEDELPMGQIAVIPEQGVELDNPAYLRMLEDFPGVTEVMAGVEDWILYFKQSEDEDDFEDAYGQSTVQLSEDRTTLINVPFEAEPNLEPMRLLEGGEWPNEGQNELIVEQRMAEEYGIEVGDTLYMRILGPSRDPEQIGATGTVEPWTVTGLVFDAYANVPKQSIYANFSDMAYLGGLNGLNDFWLRFTDFAIAEESFDEVQNMMAQQTPYQPAFALIENPEENALIMNASLISNLMSFLALVALVVSGFLVINVISSLVVEQKRQIGVMKSMGATRTDNFFIYSGIAFTYGLIGVIFGVLVGIPGGNAAAKALAPEMNTVLEGYQISVPSIILGIVVGLAVPVLASLLPVFNGTRVRILEAMTDLGIDARYGSGPVAKFIGALPIPITVRQGLSNVSIKKSRLAFTVITLAVAVGAFMGILAIFASLTSGIGNFIDSWNAQALLGPIDARDPAVINGLLYENFGDQIKSLEPGGSQQVTFEGYDPEVSAFGPPGILAYSYDIESENPAFEFTIDKGERLTPENAEDGIILSSLLAANMDKEVGDSVVLKVPGATKEMKVVGIAEFPLEQVWLEWKALAQIGGYTLDNIEGGSDLTKQIPPEASNFVRYLTMVEIGDSQAVAMGLTPAVEQFIQVQEGSFFSTEEPGVIISRPLAESGGYSAGDTITLTSTVAGGTSQDFPVVGVFDAPEFLTGGQDNMIAMFWHDLAEFDGATVTTIPRPQAYFLTTPDDDPSADKIDDLIDDINETFVGQGITLFTLNFIELTDQISAGFATIQAILLAVAGLIALVGALGLLTMLSMSVYERQKEIGVMRSIGASSSIVAVQFLTEGLVVGVISWIVGIPMMILIQYALLAITGLTETFTFEISPGAMVIGLVGMLVITTIASLWPSLAAARKTVSDILRYQ